MTVYFILLTAYLEMFHGSILQIASCVVVCTMKKKTIIKNTKALNAGRGLTFFFISS